MIARRYEMQQKINILAEKLKDYRADEILNPQAENIRRWLSQFSEQNQEVILDEMIYICKKLYFSEQRFNDFLKRLVEKYDINFWKDMSLLDIQKNGSSQKKMVEKLKELLSKQNIYISINDYSKVNYLYLDDFLYTGVKLKGDIEYLLDNIPDNSKIHVCYIGYFSFGEYIIEKNCKNGIAISIDGENKFENRKACKDVSDVLLPTDELYNLEQVRNFLTDDSKCIKRNSNKNTENYCYDSYYIFSSQKNRQILENEFTLAGLKIINSLTNKGSWKPLGFSSFDNLGFGAMVFNYRNCPNNAPLCLWWGDWDNNPVWYPLFQRTTYSN